MNKIKISKVFVAVALFAIILATSCKKYLNQTPPYGLNAEAVYSNPDMYIQVLAKLYAGLSLTGLQGPAGQPDLSPIGTDEGFSSYIRLLYNLQDVPTDAAVCGWGDVGMPELNRMTWSAENPFTRDMYRRIYYQITICNEFIRQSSLERLTQRGFSQADIERITRYHHEARFLRALSYFHAMDLYGNVPFVTEDDLVGAFQPERILRADLFDYVESELLDVIPRLANPNPSMYGHATNAAARALLARVYLNAEVYKGTPKYAECANVCLEIINSNAFSLQNNYKHVFMADNNMSPEIIFPIQHDAMFSQTWGGTTFLICASIFDSMVPQHYGVNSGWLGLRATPMLVDKFPDSTLDSRYLFFKTGQQKEITELGNKIHGYALPKYSNLTSSGNFSTNGGLSERVDTDFPMFRLADVYLMYAECAARGFADAGQGLTFFNRVRERAYGNSQHNLGSLTLGDIIDERARELHWECVRRTDLIRFNLFVEGDYVWSFKGNTAEGSADSPHKKLYPIPTNDLILNPNLIQNPGY